MGTKSPDKILSELGLLEHVTIWIVGAFLAYITVSAIAFMEMHFRIESCYSNAIGAEKIECAKIGLDNERPSH